MKSIFAFLFSIIVFLSPAAAEENYPDVNVSYDMMPMPDGYALQTIMTRPAGVTGKLPAIYYVQSLTCSTIEVPMDRDPGAYRSFLKHIATAWQGAFFRMNKAGVGTSGGTCSDLDLKREVRDHRIALANLFQNPDVDPTRVFILGASAGSMLTPLVGQGFDIAGYAYSGGFYPSWFLHMGYIHHNLAAYRAKSADEANDLIHKRTRFHFYVLYEGLAPSEIVARFPELDGVWEGNETSLYGRPLSYYRQLNALNLVKLWDEVEVPILNVYGGSDFIMGIEDQEKFISDRNKNHPGQARLVVVPRMGHSFGLFDTAEDAHFGNNPGGYARQVGFEVLRFFTDLAKQH